MDATARDGATTFPRLRGADGRLSDDGESLLVEAMAGDGEVVRFSIALADVQHFVSYLLVWTAKLGADGGSGATRVFAHPIPVSAVALGESNGADGLLGISVGPAELLFSIPLSAFDTIGRTLMMAGAQSDRAGQA